MMLLIGHLSNFEKVFDHDVNRLNCGKAEWFWLLTDDESGFMDRVETNHRDFRDVVTHPQHLVDMLPFGIKNPNKKLSFIWDWILLKAIFQIHRVRPWVEHDMPVFGVGQERVHTLMSREISPDEKF